VGGVPRIAARIDAGLWEKDWQTMLLPGRLETQGALVLALPRMEAHVLDGRHFLLETHAVECAALMNVFVQRVERRRLPYTDRSRPTCSSTHLA